MNFQVKIVLTALVILLTTFVLTSMLSLASFEKIFVAARVSSYEIAGTSLKRKIEQSLRFGKPLNTFNGMERLLAGVMDRNPEVSGVVVSTPGGQILYGAGIETGKTDLPLALAMFEPGQEVNSRLFKDTYFTAVRLNTGAGDAAGVVWVFFPRSVVYQKLKAMAFENLRFLGGLMALSALALVFLPGLVVGPVRRKLQKTGTLLHWPPKPCLSAHTGCTPTRCQSGGDDIDRLGCAVQGFVRDAAAEFDACGRADETITDFMDDLAALCRGQASLSKVVPDTVYLEYEDRERIEWILRERFFLLRRLDGLRRGLEAKSAGRENPRR